MAREFVQRLTKPEAGNKYYIRKADGGWSDAIKGKPTDRDCNVLANCVGYAYGRFNELVGEKACNYLAPVNAENFMDYKGSLKTGMTPKLGACMVWQKGPTKKSSDGAGHVAIVEAIMDNETILTSESAWNGTVFFNKTRTKGTDGNWGQGSDYKFLGFIYNPVEFTVPQPPEPPKPVEPEYKFKVGDIVTFTGKYHYVSPDAPSPVNCKRTGPATVTKISSGAIHPYHVINVAGLGSTVYGWVDEKDLTSSELQKDRLPAVGDIVTFNGGKHYFSSNSNIGSNAKAGLATITKIYNGTHPYHLVRLKGGTSTVWGWVDAASITLPRDTPPQVGDTVYFSGDTHYVWAAAPSGSKCKSGLATITKITDMAGAKYPYHLVRVDGGDSTVWGWVPADSFTVVKK